MIDLPYSLIIEATEEPDYFGFYSPDLRALQALGIRWRTASIRQDGE